MTGQSGDLLLSKSQAIDKFEAISKDQNTDRARADTKIASVSVDALLKTLAVGIGLGYTSTSL